ARWRGGWWRRAPPASAAPPPHRRAAKAAPAPPPAAPPSPAKRSPPTSARRASSPRSASAATRWVPATARPGRPTAAGGRPAEAQAMAGKGSLILTGQLGDVMKESAQAALSFARAHALALGLEGEFYAGREIHIHVPSGAVPKDGPSAGVTMACALVSLIAGVPVRHDVAMTGELTLGGKVLPIGGLKEKLLAATRAGITTCIIPAGNAPELSEIPPHVMSKITVKPVRTVDEALEIALVRRL